MAESAAEMLDAAGAKNIRPWMVPDRIPGMGIHEVGVARMGNNPKTSVLNQFQQLHDVSNLFVMDGSCFVSSGCQNPTLTIMALAVRSTEYLLGEMKGFLRCLELGVGPWELIVSSRSPTGFRRRGAAGSERPARRQPRARARCRTFGHDRTLESTRARNPCPYA